MREWIGDCRDDDIAVRHRGRAGNRSDWRSSGDGARLLNDQCDRGIRHLASEIIAGLH
jgi:hypothetical protein